MIVAERIEQLTNSGKGDLFEVLPSRLSLKLHNDMRPKYDAIIASFKTFAALHPEYADDIAVYIYNFSPIEDNRYRLTYIYCDSKTSNIKPRRRKLGVTMVISKELLEDNPQVIAALERPNVEKFIKQVAGETQ